VKRHHTLSVLLLFLSIILQGQENKSLEPQEEAPQALLDTEIEDEDVQLLFTGSWLIQTSLGLGGENTPFGWSYTAAYPGIERGVLFQQRPNILIELWLFQKYFFQGQYQGEEGSNEIALGLEGEEGDILQWVQLGNRPSFIRNFAQAPETTVPGGIPSFVLRSGSQSWSADLLLKHRQREGETLLYRGDEQVERTTLLPSDYIPGRFFLVPDSPQALELLIADPSGPVSHPLTGANFRPMGPEDYLYDGQGLISLPQALPGTLLITFPGIGNYTDPQTGAILNTLVLSDGRSYLPLRLNGKGTILELKNRYPLNASAFGPSPRIELLETGSLRPIAMENRRIIWPPGESYFLFLGSGAQEDKPFWDQFPNLYIPGEENQTAYTQYFSLETSGLGKGYNLGQNVIPESIRVKISGSEVQGYEFEPLTGQVYIKRPVYPEDLVEISFQREQSQGQATEEIGLVHTGQWLNPTWGKVEWNLGGDWSFPEEPFSRFPGQNPGSIRGALEWEKTFGPWTLEGGIRASLRIPDTAGNLKAQDMELGTTTLFWNPQGIMPGVWAPWWADEVGPLPLLGPLTSNNRGRLYDL